MRLATSTTGTGCASALDKPEWLDDPRFTTRHERSKHAAVVHQAMQQLMANMTMHEAIAHFTKHDVVAAPVNTIPQAAQDPHPWERRAMVEVPDFLAGSIAVSGDFWHFGRTPAIVGSTPKVGEHNEEVLGGLLGTPSRDRRAVCQERHWQLGPVRHPLGLMVGTLLHVLCTIADTVARTGHITSELGGQCGSITSCKQRQCA